MTETDFQGFMPLLSEAAHGIGVEVSAERFALLEKHYFTLVELSRRYELDLFPQFTQDELVRYVYGGAFLGAELAVVNPGSTILDATGTGGVAGLALWAVLEDVKIKITAPGPVEREILEKTFDGLQLQDVDVVAGWLDGRNDSDPKYDLVILPADIPPEDTIPMADGWRKPDGKILLIGTGIQTHDMESVGEELMLDLETYDHQWLNTEQPIVASMSPFSP